MKKYLNLLNIFLPVVLLVTGLQSKAANDPEVEKRKTYSKSYSVSSSDKVSVHNQFGEVKVNVWNKNEVKVDITIISKSSTDERAQEILDRINIEDNKKSDGVYFKTNMKDNNHRSGKKNYKDEKMEINYQVYMPVSNPLVVNNQFGATIIPDMNGQVDLTSKFGSLTTGKLQQVKKLTIEFGTANIESISNGNVEIKFSRAIINKIDGAVNAVFEHCSGVKMVVENGTKDLMVTSAFTNLFLDFDKNVAATFTINTSFGELSNKTDFDIREDASSEKKSPNFNRSYSGKSGNGNSNMRIVTSFSKVLMGHNLAMDLKEEKKKTTNI